MEVRASVGGRLEKIDFKSGAEIKKGDVLFEIDPAAYCLSLDKARAELDVAEAQKKFSEAELTRALRLKEKGSIGQQDYDQIVASEAIAEAKSRVAQAEVDRAELKLEATKIKAPVDGVIGQPRVDLGNHVTEEGGRSLLLATILSLDPIRLGFNMDQASFLRYRRLMREHEVKGPGSAVSMELLDEKDFSRPGTLENFDVRIDPETGTVRVHGTFPNRDRLLLPGLSARVRIAFGRPRQVLEVPESAIQRRPSNVFVYVVGERDLMEKRAVKLGPTDNGMRIIEDGLHEGDWVVGNVDELNQAGGRITFERATKKLKSP